MFEARKSSELQELRSADEDEMTVEANNEYDENSINMSDEVAITDRAVDNRENVFDMRKPVEKKIVADPEQDSLPPWRRMNPLNADTAWKPPPPPPMPVKRPVATTSTSTTTTTTTTTLPPTTTTTLSYEQKMRQYEELRRQRELERQREMEKRAELERQRLEERRHHESQFDTRRRFGEESQQWPVAAPFPTTTTTTTTTTTPRPTTTTSATTTTTTTQRPTTTTTPPVTTKKESKTNYNQFYRNWRRPFDLNPTQSVRIFAAY
uniref:Uncharacterized protein n=1 Tax=Caenorhabditis japonica TaxID=281687 RepID=A0A8R1HYL0_CAEJA